MAGMFLLGTGARWQGNRFPGFEGLQALPSPCPRSVCFFSQAVRYPPPHAVVYGQRHVEPTSTKIYQVEHVFCMHLWRGENDSGARSKTPPLDGGGRTGVRGPVDIHSSVRKIPTRSIAAPKRVSVLSSTGIRLIPSCISLDRCVRVRARLHRRATRWMRQGPRGKP